MGVRGGDHRGQHVSLLVVKYSTNTSYSSLILFYVLQSHHRRNRDILSFWRMIHRVTTLAEDNMGMGDNCNPSTVHEESDTWISLITKIHPLTSIGTALLYTKSITQG